MRKQKCKKKDCWNRTNGKEQYCDAHLFELELKVMQAMHQQKK